MQFPINIQLAKLLFISHACQSFVSNFRKSFQILIKFVFKYFTIKKLYLTKYELNE